MVTQTTTKVGTPMPLFDGPAKVSGSLRFAADLSVPGLLVAKFLPSPYAHANIRSIDKSAALAVPGVVAVLTAEDLPNIAPSQRSRLLLARGRVISAGQPVALVIATSSPIAEDAVNLIHVDYEPLPAAISIAEALAPGAPLVWPNGIPSGSDDASMHGAAHTGEQITSDALSNISDHFIDQRGDVEQGFAEAEVVIEHTFTSPIVHQSYIEPQSIIVQPDPIKKAVTVWTSTQGQFPVREDVAAVLGIPEVDVRVIGTPVGGGFGGKIKLYEPLVALAALAVKRPVKLVLTRMEELMAANPAPAARIWLKLGAKRDGTLTALDAKIDIDAGNYSGGLAGTFSFFLGSQYRLPHYRMETTEVLTFKVSASAYRAPGAPTAAFALETEMDELAHLLDIDPFELRLMNASREGDMRSDDKPWPVMGMSQVLETLQAHPAWQERETARAAGRGIGIAVGGWMGGTEPTAAACMIDRDGMLNVHIGSNDLSGTATTFTLMAAEAFGVSVDQVRVIVGDTATAPFAGEAAGSKTTYTVGPAVIQAAEEARKQVLAIAADEFEADAADLEIVNDMVQVRGVPSRAIPLKKLAAGTFKSDSNFGPIIAHGRHANPEQAPGFCAQLAEIEVDQETGEVIVHRLVVVQDAGKAINPAAVHGQMMGGSTQGLGWALYEQLVYSEDGQVLTGTLMDYAVPGMPQAARRYETIIVEVPTPSGPYGARGVGEPPIIATAAAVANAIYDATGARPLDLPMTPPTVLAALNGKQ